MRRFTREFTPRVLRQALRAQEYKSLQQAARFACSCLCGCDRPVQDKPKCDDCSIGWHYLSELPL